MTGNGKVQLHIHQASVPVEVEDLVACLWVSAQSGALDPHRVESTEEATDLVRATVLYLLLTQHAHIVAARHQMAKIRPTDLLWPVLEQVRHYAATLFTTPDPCWDLTDQCRGGGL